MNVNLQSYVNVTLASYVVRFNGRNNSSRKCFCVHARGTSPSNRLRKWLESPDPDLPLNHPSLNEDEQQPHTPKRQRTKTQKRVRGNCEQVRIADFYVDWVRAYAEICPDDPLPLEWFLMHLYAWKDIPPETRPRVCGKRGCCFLDKGLATINPEFDTVCTQTHLVEDAGRLVVILALIKWFRAPGVIANHIEQALVYRTFYSDLTHFVLGELQRVSPIPAMAPEFSLLHRATASLLYSTCPSPVTIMCLTGPLVAAERTNASVQSSLQTLGARGHHPRYFETRNNSDAAHFMDRFLCEFVIDGEPLLCFMDNWLLEDDSADEFCPHVTEALLICSQNNQWYTFTFGAMRTAQMATDLYVNDSVVESISLRNASTRLAFNWEFDNDTGEYAVSATYICSTNGAYVTPCVTVDFGFVAACQAGHEPELCESPQYSHAVTFRSNDSYDGSCIVTSEIAGGSRVWTCEWRCSNEYFVRGWDDQDGGRMFIIRGSVRFHNPDFRQS